MPLNSYMGLGYSKKTCPAGDLAWAFIDETGPYLSSSCGRTVQNSYAEMVKRVGLWPGGCKPGPFGPYCPPGADGGADAGVDAGVDAGPGAGNEDAGGGAEVGPGNGGVGGAGGAGGAGGGPGADRPVAGGCHVGAVRSAVAVSGHPLLLLAAGLVAVPILGRRRSRSRNRSRKGRSCNVGKA